MHVRDIDVCINLWLLVTDHLWVLFPDVCMVIASETVVDIVKHAFITKFNDITADVSCMVYQPQNTGSAIAFFKQYDI